MTWMTWLFQRKVAWFSHSGQVFLDHGVHPIYDKNDKEATSSLKVSVISRLPCSKKDGKRFNKRALLDKGCWVGLTTWFEWMRQCRFQESAVGVFLFAKNLQSLELQLDGFRKVAFRLDRKHCFFFQADLPGESTDFGLEAWVLGLCLDAGAGCSGCWLLQKVAAIFHAGLWGRQKVLSCFCFLIIEVTSPTTYVKFFKRAIPLLCWFNKQPPLPYHHYICAMVWIPVLSFW